MTIDKKVHGGQQVLTICGRLETATAPQLDAEVKAIAPEVKNLRIEMADMEYVSSAGLRVLLTAQKTMNARQGRMELAGVNDSVKHVFDITGFSPVLTFV